MKLVFHATFFSVFAFICYKDAEIIPVKALPIPNVFLSKFVWLTMIDLYMQTFYHFFGILVALVGSGKNNKIYDYWGRTLAGPIGLAVTILFWTLYLADPDTLAKDDMAKKILSIQWYNHGIHTLPAISAHLNLLVWKHERFSTTSVLKGIAIFITLYLIDIHVVHHISGFWAYPILGQLALPARALFILVCVIVVFLCYLWLAFVDRLVHGDKIKRKNY